MGTQLVWLKRDLRLRDHAPLFEASRRGPTIVLYVYEPSLWQTPEMDGSHLRFINECLAELEGELRQRGARLTRRIGEMPDLLAEIHRAHPIETLWSHQETGNRTTYDRDLRVAAWCRENAIEWREPMQHGVFRPLKKRDGWARKWKRQMEKECVPVPEHFEGVELEGQGEADESALRIEPSRKGQVQAGGTQAGLLLLDSFLAERGVNYRADMSTPVAGWDGCSRLSPHFAWGSLSIREVYQRAKEREAELKAAKADGMEIDSRWLPSLSSFFSRLSWHCHFIQKLEDEPEIEFRNMARVYDGLREDEFDEARFEAFCAGQTGYPMVDACMRCLHETGWLNFRMRAMLVSFSSYHLWLHWRRPAQYLAAQFLDFEPGIHFSQFQMQSGVTGINSVRVYSPAKQAQDQDPRGVFIRRWVPELEGVDDAHLPEPHRMPPLLQRTSGCVIGRDYPAPVVDHKRAYKTARERIFAVRRREEAKKEAAEVYQRHGSRKRPRSRKRPSPAAER